MKRWLGWFLPVVVLAACGGAGGPAGHEEVSPQAAQEKMARGAVAVIDVRTREEFAAGHLAGATLVPVGADGFVAKVRAAAAGKPVLVYCLSGHRSGKAAAQLAAAGEQGVSTLHGGIQAWQKAGKPVEK